MTSTSSTEHPQDGSNSASTPAQGNAKPNPDALTMQDLLLTLQRFWTERGAMVAQPFNTEVGAGTGNPATALRVLGPEPWRVAYVEPSVRPDDARYGENPNRLQTHTQFQVILKPDPGNPQEIYLDSLRALGVDLDAHDIRFVEDNWAAPALGAWGLGWEVWLDGLEITQFTYFQQAGGVAVDPVSVEITYGIERIVMALQGVNHFKNIAYVPGISYGEVFGQAEYEMSRYYLDDADIATNTRLFDDYAAEAQRMLELRLPVPAYVYALKCSHTFNVLDARGAISTTERATAFARMRALTKGSALLWAERREELGYPLGVVTPPPAATLPDELPTVTEPATLLFEIGVEELPYTEVTRSCQAVRAAVAEKLAVSRLGHGDVRAYATPRRIVVIVDDVQPTEPDAQRTVKGPKTAAAFDADGSPTKASLGFARGQKIEVADLQRVTIDGVEHVGVLVTDVGRGAAAVLSELLGRVVAELRAEKNMRWRDAGLQFTRPVRWLLAMLGDTPIPVAVSSLSAGTTTRVHRTAPEPVVTVPRADGYLEFLASHDIVADTATRREQIVVAATGLATTVAGRIDVDGESALIDQLAALVESPTAVLGSFDEKYLELPEAILTTVMRKHQRYLPVRGANEQGAALLPYFVAVANGSCNEDLVRDGYASVLRARYEDAAFFWRADQKTTPAQHQQRLDKLTFADGLGSVADRARRIAAVAGDLAEMVYTAMPTAAEPSGAKGPGVHLKVDMADRIDRRDSIKQERVTLQRAGELAKFDLATQMVVELSSLAGTMAKEYATRSGESEQVATALAEMEQPRSAGDPLPQSTPGALLALADRFDLLAGLFSIGAKPTGSSDPFGLRRAALGIVSILRARPGVSAVSLSSGLSAAAKQLTAQGVSVSDQALADAHEFAVRRYEQAVLDGGVPHSLVQAALPLADVPAAADAAIADLQSLTADEQFTAMSIALQRSRRIVGADVPADYDASKLTEPADRALHETLRQVADSWQGGGVADFARIATPLTAPINTFFDEVLVNADDPQVRAARRGLLATINLLSDGLVDWAALEG